jgi:hypothetical protein
MPVTGDQLKEGAIYTVAQVRKVIFAQAIIALLIAGLTGFGTYWYASYVDIANRLEQRLPELEENRDEWLSVSATIFTDANPNLSQNPELPSIEDVRNIQETVTALISYLNSVPTPTGPIEQTTTAFRASLSEVIREIGRYDATAEATTRIVQASNIAARVGGYHRAAVEDYLGSTYHRLIGSF